MEDEINSESLFNEIDEVQSQLDSLKKTQEMQNTPRASESLFISSFQAIIGLIFLGLFFLSAVLGFNPVITTIFFAGSFIGLIPTITDIFTKKEFSSLKLIGSIFLIVESIAYVFLWMNILNPYIDLIYLILSLLFFLVIIFFLVHAYFAYLRRIANKEIKILSAIGGIGFILFLVGLLISHFLLLTIYLIVVGLFIKGVIDLTDRFRS